MVIINGMELPKTCDECPLLTFEGDYDVCFVEKRRVMWNWKYERGSEVIHPKPSWCPMLEARIKMEEPIASQNGKKVE